MRYRAPDSVRKDFPNGLNKPSEWGQIVSFLQSVKGEIRISICASCGFAKIYDVNKKEHRVARGQSLDTVKKIVENIKKINAGSI